MSRRLFCLMLVVTVLSLAAAGCDRQEESPPPHARVEKARSRVVVPESVQGQWKAVKIAIFDKQTEKETVYTVDIGYDFSVGDDGLRVKVENFLPAFIMDGKVMTSASNATKNPAAQIVISKQEKVLFDGWLFSLYPSTHAFDHPRYSLTLVDFVPAGGKKG